MDKVNKACGFQHQPHAGMVIELRPDNAGAKISRALKQKAVTKLLSKYFVAHRRRQNACTKNSL
jgi:hypothetical protein